MDKILTNVKAVAATLGAVISALLGSGIIPAGTDARVVLVLLGVILTAVATASIPNETRGAAARRSAKADR